MTRYRFTFRFVRAEDHAEQEVVIVGTHPEDARSGAWAVLGERTLDSRPRQAWRMTSTVQESLRGQWVVPEKVVKWMERGR